MKNVNRTALVTGANRGIGLEVARQLAANGLRVYLGCRDLKKGEDAASAFRQGGADARVVKLDTSDAASMRAAIDFIARDSGRLDVLVNNAGIFPDREGTSIVETKLDAVREALETNTFGPLQLCQLAVPLMKKGGYGRIVNLSSGMGQLTEMNGGYPAYRISKTALNAVTRIFSDELEGSGILVNSVCPGWVKTDMGGPAAERPVEEGADTVVWAATLPDGGPTGGFFRDREPMQW